MGGVTRLVVNGADFTRVSSNLVLIGTIRNCAGGISPWGWLSCEENTDEGHGYVFVCPTDAESVQPPQRVVPYGRFNHEAAAVDPETLICYLTEDRGDSSFYRFVPSAKDKPFEGQLQALKVVGEDAFETTNMKIGDTVEVEWVDVDEPDPEDDTVRVEAQDKGAAIFVRGEGLWIHDGEVYICSTSGGAVDSGQIFKLTPDGDGGTLELLTMSEDTDVLEYPDNITVAPWGELFMAEDGDGEQYIRALSAEGEIYDFARNAVSDSEFAGVCFSPDGKAMFVNIQGDGLTLVVTGPFPSLDPGETDTDTDGTDTDGTGTDGTDTDDPSTSGTDSTDGSGSDSDGSTSGTGTSDGGTGTGTGGTGGSDSSDSSDTTAGPDAGGDTDTAGMSEDGGCGCDVAESRPGLGLAATVVAVAGARALLTRGDDDDDAV
ncbi:MAG: DUF839 domain-containing protein [Nannocystaceae bacterium]